MLRANGGNGSFAVAGILLASLAVHLAGATRLAGTWTLDKTRGELPGGEATLNSTLTVDVAADVVTVRRTGFVGGGVTLNRYELDGQPHSYSFGDAVPQSTAIRTAAWLQDADGFEVVTESTTERWTVSPNGRSLSIETVVRHPCPPCSPPSQRIDHTVFVFAKQH
jgi:hypothetical protein